MPFVRLSLHQGKSPLFLQTLADTVHQTLVDAFEVPPDDRFQVIHEVPTGLLFFSPDYLGIRRSPNFLLVEITAGRSRSTLTKTRLYQTLASRLSEKLHIRPEDIMVVVLHNTAEDWSFGCGEAQMLRTHPGNSLMEREAQHAPDAL
ncbi:tautomerase family protein [Deinococcus cellulosilyticus]|uniref:Putative tautomerase YusQ n=1 Tax=Deinococcus cellulosilyticus (strain DSM 18568 / NBRC 106333 / KACC 11606 / 5516J-15) TaxID=1223518 RepID=A0A511NA98_DEIC1|nr:tautomerase family protein [Deinococcus cellulosilyticus]GEM49291.1 putative tautomerase YusQ [Deinococcus cellulosilyticus NBRC 106333 = KACC 11606]